MITIYLKSITKENLISDIANVIEEYNGEVEFSNGEIHLHYIGQLPDSINPETGHVMSWKDGYHANILVPDNFDKTIFSTLVIPPPGNPVHKFAEWHAQ